MQKIVRLCLVALVTLIALASIVKSLGEQCCPPGRGNFRNPMDKYPLNEPVYTSNGIVFCKGQRCNEITTCQLDSAYGALFAVSPPAYLQEISTGQCNSVSTFREKRASAPVCTVGDGDRCCETEVYSTRIHGRTKNANNETVYVLCLPDSAGSCNKYQFVANGTCVPERNCSSNNQPCTQEYTVHTLLAYKANKISFEPIRIPAYCSCKNIRG